MSEPREILFRALRLDNGEWVEGDYYSQEGSHYIVENSVMQEEYYIKRQTLSQYTGLRDKDGERIWEGSIGEMEVEDCDDPSSMITCRYHVIFFEGEYGFPMYEEGHPFRFESSLREDLENEEWKIVGDIHTTPELLEDGKG